MAPAAHGEDSGQPFTHPLLPVPQDFPDSGLRLPSVVPHQIELLHRMMRYAQHPDLPDEAVEQDYCLPRGTVLVTAVTESERILCEEFSPPHCPTEEGYGELLCELVNHYQLWAGPLAMLTQTDSALIRRYLETAAQDDETLTEIYTKVMLPAFNTAAAVIGAGQRSQPLPGSTVAGVYIALADDGTPQHSLLRLLGSLHALAHTPYSTRELTLCVHYARKVLRYVATLPLTGDEAASGAHA